MASPVALHLAPARQPLSPRTVNTPTKCHDTSNPTKRSPLPPKRSHVQATRGQENVSLQSHILSTAAVASATANATTTAATLTCAKQWTTRTGSTHPALPTFKQPLPKPRLPTVLSHDPAPEYDKEMAVWRKSTKALIAHSTFYFDALEGPFAQLATILISRLSGVHNPAYQLSC